MDRPATDLPVGGHKHVGYERIAYRHEDDVQAEPVASRRRKAIPNI